MIRMTANIAGYEVEITGHAADVVVELETLRKELTGEKPRKASKKKTGPGTHDDQPDLPLEDGKNDDPEPQAEAPKAEEPPAVSETQYTIEDVRAAIKDADKDGKDRAKGFLIEHGAEKDGKPQLMMLDAQHFGALIAAVGGES